MGHHIRAAWLHALPRPSDAGRGIELGGAVGGERTPLTGEWLRDTRHALLERENAIIRSMLQMPDYPPLPECPRCHVAPERIDTRQSEPRFGQTDVPTFIDFSPCGHGFQISEAEILRA
jgi:hypothetical protein